MARRNREINVFSMAFLDVLSCGLGAMILLFIIVPKAELPPLKDEETTFELIADDLILIESLLQTDDRERIQEALERIKNHIAKLRGQILKAGEHLAYCSSAPNLPDRALECVGKLKTAESQIAETQKILQVCSNNPNLVAQARECVEKLKTAQAQVEQLEQKLIETQQTLEQTQAELQQTQQQAQQTQQQAQQAQQQAQQAQQQAQQIQQQLQAAQQAQQQSQQAQQSQEQQIQELQAANQQLQGEVERQRRRRDTPLLISIEWPTSSADVDLYLVHPDRIGTGYTKKKYKDVRLVYDYKRGGIGPEVVLAFKADPGVWNICYLLYRGKTTVKKAILRGTDFEEALPKQSMSSKGENRLIASVEVTENGEIINYKTYRKTRCPMRNN